jgi:hypothetical protein
MGAAHGGKLYLLGVEKSLFYPQKKTFNFGHRAAVYMKNYYGSKYKAFFLSRVAEG